MPAGVRDIWQWPETVIWKVNRPFTSRHPPSRKLITMAFGAYSSAAKKRKSTGMEVEKLSGRGKRPHHVVMMVEQFPWEGVVVASDVQSRGECVLIFMHMHTCMRWFCSGSPPSAHVLTDTHIPMVENVELNLRVFWPVLNIREKKSQWVFISTQKSL